MHLPFRTSGICLILLLSSLSAGAAPMVRLKAGMVIRESVVVNRENYSLNAKGSLAEGLIVIEGNNIIVDLNQAVLQGSNDKASPDAFYGLALFVKKGSRNITIKNAVIHGYKVAILADSVENLAITNCDLSYNWRQHLQSNLQREDISDWMSYHKNENGEWLRYGAAIYLLNCNKAVIAGNTITGGQCALLMTKCMNATVSDNDFSFNSGLGIGMYRSSKNSIYHNRLDYNVRGYSFGHYKRGQDSAGILVFEQSSNNIFAFNSATHSGDGFFLWAGQSTMDTGKGGCNDNFIYGNDFSNAPTNGIEITFSRNLVMKNILRGCENGIWGGYSFDTDITDNTFYGNKTGIAIEHGQNINIVLNNFTENHTGVKLWSREKQPPEWAYARLRNTESRNYWIAANKFTSDETAFDIMGTDTVVFSGNKKVQVNRGLVVGDRSENIDTSREEELLEMEYQKDPRLQTINATALPAAIVPQGKKEMRITEWGPYDFRYPLIWLNNIDSAGLYHFEVLGPGLEWQVLQSEGFEFLTRQEGIFPATLLAKADTAITERRIQLSYRGGTYTDAFGKRHESSRNQVFEYREFDPLARWHVSWFRWDSAHAPGGDYTVFEQALKRQPLHSAVTGKIDYTWWGSIAGKLPADSFATEAVSVMNLKEGEYEVAITADDFAKLFIDSKEVINAWDAKFTEMDENTHHRIRISLSAGQHHFRIVHAENTGLATLMFYIRPA